LGIPLSFAGEFEEVIMIEVAIEEMVGSDRVPDLQRLEASLRLARQISTRAKWRSAWSGCSRVLENHLDTADIVRDGDFATVETIA
jgi:hypothetical protein